MIQIETGPTKYKHPFLSVAQWTYSRNILQKIPEIKKNTKQ